MLTIEKIKLDLTQILNEGTKDIAQAKNVHELDNLKSKYLGKKSAVNDFFQLLKELSNEEKPKLGQLINDVKVQLESILQKRCEELTTITETKLIQEQIDITLAGRGQDLGSLHPVTKARERMEAIFTSMGFIVFDDPENSPEIEDEWHNFTALNIPQHHPSRSTSDTFYLENSELLLRTQTSNAQIRALEALPLPLRVITPGRVYRRDFDVTHTPMFHQMEGLLVSEQANFAELKGILNNFLENFFSRQVALRFRPSYFPFTEPSAEVDLQCLICNGKGCRVCQNTGWKEILGCGMVHPNVLKAVNADTETYTGFAFGIGIDRMAMFYYGINDLRLLFENDLRFLEQF